MEGCAFAVCDNLRVAEATGVHVTEWLGTGGAATSATWNQIKADVTGRPFVVARRADGREGGHGLGLYALAAEAVGLGETPPRPSSGCCPDARTGNRRHARYEHRSRCHIHSSRGLLPHSTASRRCRRWLSEGRSPRSVRQLVDRDVANRARRRRSAARDEASAVCGLGRPPLPSWSPNVSHDHGPRPRGSGIVSAIGPGVDEAPRGGHAALSRHAHACAQCRAGRFSACAPPTRSSAHAAMAPSLSSWRFCEQCAARSGTHCRSRPLHDRASPPSRGTCWTWATCGRETRPSSSGPDRSGSCSSSGCRILARGLSSDRVAGNREAALARRARYWTPPTMTSPRRSCTHR